MTRQAYQFPDQKIVVFWTPKAACTTITRKIGIDVFGRTPEEFADTPGKMRGWLRRSEHWVSGADAMALCVNENYRSIALVRDPYDRLISAYVNKFVRDIKQDLTREDLLQPFARAFFRSVVQPDLDSTAPYEGITFRQFAAAVCGVIDARGESEPQLDHHWNTQIPFAFSEAGFQYDELFELSHANLFFQRFSELFDIPNIDRKMNATTYGKNNSAALQDVSSLSIIKLNGFSKEQFHDAQIAAMVRRSFDVDYAYLQNAVVA